MIKLVFIGKDFYWKSKTVMSSIYTESGDRYDWGFLQMALDEGHEVHIRQANKVEREHYDKLLASVLARQMD